MIEPYVSLWLWSMFQSSICSYYFHMELPTEREFYQMKRFYFQRSVGYLITTSDGWVIWIKIEYYYANIFWKFWNELRCQKIQALAQLLPSLKQDGHRVLIFSQWTSMLDILEWTLDVIGLTYRRLDGRYCSNCLYILLTFHSCGKD